MAVIVVKEEDIKAKARKVYDISFNYHLTHAIFGADWLLMDDARNANKKNIEKLKNDLLKASREKKSMLVKRIMKKIEECENSLLRKHHILVDYINMDDPGAGRVIKVNGKLIISLPKKIIEDIVEKDTGKLNKDAVNNLRRIMAHELAHIVLHTDHVPGDDLQGAKKLEELDGEAKIFVDELLHLYSKRDHRI